MTEQGSSRRGDVVFYVVRHGQTAFNESHRIQGWSNAPLTEEGVAAARTVGAALEQIEFARAYSSDLGRAVQTLDELLDAQNEKRALLGKKPANIVEVAHDERLREWCYGDLEGEPAERMRERFIEGFGRDCALPELNDQLPEVARVLAEGDTSGRAESFDDISARILDFFGEVANEVSDEGGGDVLVVTHSFVIRTLVYLLDCKRVNEPLKYPNTSLTRVLFHNGEFDLLEIGCTQWMSALQHGALLTDRTPLC